MKIVNLQQNSIEWLSWRRQHICATDAAVITGSSPYSTSLELWQRKLGLIAEPRINAAMMRGSELEPIARAWFCQEYGIMMEPCVVESSEYNFLGASLDGISVGEKIILEIKCNGPRNHGLAKEGHIADYHRYQIYHQLICTRVEKAFYLSYTGDDNIVIDVTLDPEFEEHYLPIAKEFWRKVVYLEEPEHFQLKTLKI